MTATADTTAHQAKDEIDLVALLGVVWRGKYWIMLCMAVFVSIAIYYGTRVAVPMYPARATLALEAQQQQVIGDIESIFSRGDSSPLMINTQFEVLRSRTLIGQLVDELDLVRDPEFNGSLRDPGAIARLRMSMTDWVPTPVTEGERVRNRVIDRLIGSISVVGIRQSLAFNIIIETTDPQKSADIVNTLADLYVDFQIQQKLDEATRAIEFLSQRTAELEVSVETMEQDLARRMDASNVVDAQLLAAQNLQLRDLRGRVEDAQTRLAEDRALRATFETITEVEALVTALEGVSDARFAGILQRFRAGRLSEEATLIALDGIADDLNDDIRRTQTQLATLEASADDLSVQLARLSDELIEIQQLEREVEASRLLYETFLTRLQEASIQQGLETADSTILSRAVPRRASSPRVVMMVFIAICLGGLLGSAIVLMRELRFAGFRTLDDLRAYTGRPGLAALPAMTVRGRKQVLKALKDKPNSIFAEAVRNLRTSILMVKPDHEPQVILVTSSVPGEGKTTLSLALARYMGSLDGRRVLLLEADIRRQTLRAYVDDERKSGVKLVDVVMGKSSLDQADLLDPDLGVEVLMGSGGEFNAADLFESRRFRELITRLCDVYDHIIIDSPPVLAVPDARVLSRYADAVVFAVRWGSTSRTQVRQGLDMLQSVGHPADGTVLTQVDQKKMKSYGYSGQYGYDDSSSNYYAQD